MKQNKKINELLKPKSPIKYFDNICKKETCDSPELIVDFGNSKELQTGDILEGHGDIIQVVHVGKEVAAVIFLNDLFGFVSNINDYMFELSFVDIPILEDEYVKVNNRPLEFVNKLNKPKDDKFSIGEYKKAIMFADESISEQGFNPKTAEFNSLLVHKETDGDDGIIMIYEDSDKNMGLVCINTDLNPL